MDENNNEEEKKFEIVQGRSKDLDISPVKDNFTIEVHENPAQEGIGIIVPSDQKKQEDQPENNDDSESN